MSYAARSRFAGPWCYASGRDRKTLSSCFGVSLPAVVAGSTYTGRSHFRGNPHPTLQGATAKTEKMLGSKFNAVVAALLHGSIPLRGNPRPTLRGAAPVSCRYSLDFLNA